MDRETKFFENFFVDKKSSHNVYPIEVTVIPMPGDSLGKHVLKQLVGMSSSTGVLRWPQRCCCCGGDAEQSTLDVEFKQWSGSTTLRTTTFKMPCCRSCVAHTNAGWWAFVAQHKLWGKEAKKRKAFEKAKALTTPHCTAVAIPPAVCTKLEGAHITFQFANTEFANEFASLNFEAKISMLPFEESTQKRA